MVDAYGLTLYGHIKTAEQRTIIQQYGDWYTGRWWVQRGGAWAAGAQPSPLHAVPNVTAHPLMASVPNSYYLMWHYNGLWTLKGYTKVRNCMTLSGCFAMTGWQISDGLCEVCSSRNSNDRVRLHATFHHVTSMTLLTSPTCLFAVCYALVRVHASRVKCIVTCKKARWYVCVYVDAFVCSDGQYLIVLWLIT